ncbi:uncharacterized protein LOC119570264 [Penaeus monodon]|uniref:uncharacterized protein LOC119570264 n=1 Tax=Penaeus monodon TaxID=6687 RepID=UPI0018A70871|nr:uncharacterized protein LOC119570264 [Penaeus monodon]
MLKIPRTERVGIGADLNGHVGGGRKGIWRNIGKFGFGTRNEEGQTILDFVAANKPGGHNTYFKKKDREDHLHKGWCELPGGLCHMRENDHEDREKEKTGQNREDKMGKLNEQEHREKFVEKVREGMEAQAEKRGGSPAEC